MRIIKFEIQNLFGIYNHEIYFNLDSKITIMIGRNGIGKTFILKLLFETLNRKFSTLRKTPFEKMAIEFDDGSYVRALKQKNKNDTEDTCTIFVKYKNVRKDFTLNLNEDFEIPLHAISSFYPQLERIGSREWFDTLKNEKVLFDDILNNYDPPFSREKHGKPKREGYALFSTLCNSIDVRLLETQRLLQTRTNKAKKFDDQKTELGLTVEYCAKQLSELIKAHLAQYASLSQTLDRNFPVRLVKQAGFSILSIAELKSNLKLLEEKRLQLEESGLLEKEEAMDFHELQSAVNEHTKDVLSVYVNDVTEKLSFFDAISRKIDLFRKIINSKFANKKIFVNPQDGFQFSIEGKTLVPKDLSSGEQHFLVMFYELLFNVKSNSLILIDEPELSLHIVWQKQFLKDLQQVIELSPFDVVIATHSPQFINDRWDLAVELAGE